ncbi:MAG: hypothetical protein IBX61_02950 [Thermoleophilia bacterium]|nr:hypothetical protein [Thermoleophilia bacterium]
MKTTRIPPSPETRSQHRLWAAAGPARLKVAACLLALAMAAAVLIMVLAASAPAYEVTAGDEPETGEFELTPTKFELSVDPGDEIAVEVTLVNRTGQTLDLEFHVEDFEGSDDPAQAFVFLGDEDADRGARSWVTPEIDDIVLRHGETLTMQASISVPEGSRPGGHYASLVATADVETTGEEDGRQAVPGRRDSLLLFRVSGPAVEDGTLDAPEVTRLAASGPVAVGLVFNNTGDVDLSPSGRVEITDLLGRTVAEIFVEEWVVLPDASRRTVVNWNPGLLSFGRYTVWAEMGYGSEEPAELAVSQTFWLVPWQLLLFIAALLLLAALILLIIVRRRGRGATGRRVSAEAPPAGEKSVKAGPYREPAVRAPVREKTAARPRNLVPMTELFPSMEDARLVDLEDPETVGIIRQLIQEQLDMARSLYVQGDAAGAQGQLKEARQASRRIGWWSEIGMIDDMLDWLS